MFVLCSKKSKSSQDEEADSHDNEDSIYYRLQQTPSMTDSDEVIHRLTANDRQFYQVYYSYSLGIYAI